MVLSEQLHIGQQIVAQTPGRFKVVACGRRFGKTELGKLLLMDRALYRQQRTWWLAPTYTMASQVWRDLKAMSANVTGIQISESERRIDFPGGGFMALRSAHHPDTLRGAGLDYVVLDEAAFMEPSVWPQIVRPMLLERRGEALFLSTPYGKNWFWELFQRGRDPLNPEWVAFQFPSAVNPQISQQEIDAIRRSTTERVFREEYEAQFLDDAGQVFRGIREAATAPLDVRPLAGHRYVMGIDWGREGDYSALVVIDATTQHMVALDRFHKIGWSVQRGRVLALAQRWNVALIWAEANSMGSVNIEALQADGLPVRPFMTTARSKAPLIEGLSLAIERGDLALQPHEVLLNELAAYSLERMPGGSYRYGAPPGLHDDTVIAAALAWHGARSGALRVDFA